MSEEFIDTSKECSDEGTLAEALDMSIHMWTDIAEKDYIKVTWPGWKYLRPMRMYCPLCDYTIKQSKSSSLVGNCRIFCPIANGEGEDFACEQPEHPYHLWHNTTNRYTRMSHARDFVKELKGYRANLDKPKEEWIDITKDCVPYLIKSQSSDGYYISLHYKKGSIAIFGVDDSKPFQPTSGYYRIVKADGARLSFRVYKRTAV